MDLNTEDLIKKIDSRADQSAVDALLGRVDGIDAKLATLGETDVAKVDEPEAELKRGMFDELMSIKVWDIPVGQAAIGGFAAIFASELIDGFMKDQQPWQRGLVKLGVAGVSAKWGKRFLGDLGSKAVCLLLAFDGIRDLSPIDSWADQLAEKITGTTTTAGLAGNQASGQNVNASSARTSSGQSFYSKALGG